MFFTPPPFDHTKLLIVDESWSLIGSTNWDPRSLRLNFEFNVESYDSELVSRLDAIVAGKIDDARPVSRDELERRALPIRLRDAAAWLFSPYL